ncbi:non-ribosomal peptide synthetase [Marinactinospora endophytica]
MDAGLLLEHVVRALRGHDAFRFRFGEDGEGDPVARLDPADPDAWTPEVETVDLSGEEDPRQAVRAWRERELGRPLDIVDGRPFYAALVREGPEALHLFLKAHHIIVDAWALNRLTLEILSAYRAHGGEGASEIGPSPSFVEAIAQQRAYHGSEQYERDRAFHRENLRDVAPALFARGGAGRPRRGRHSFVIDGKTVGRILEAGASPFAYLATAFGACLARIHRCTETVLGVPFLNRHTEGERAVVGQFANNLPLRVTVDEATPLLDLAEQVRGRLRELREYERLPFGEILRELPAQGADARRLFDVTLSYMRYPRPSEIPGVTRTTTIMAPVHDANVLSVMVHAFEDEEGLRVDLDYARDVFDGDFTAEALAGHVQELIRKGLDLRELPLSALSMLTAEEYEEVVRLRQGETAPYPAEKTLHELFAEQAARHPDLPAVVDDASGEVLSYAELDRRSNQVARALRADGVGPGERVAVMARRGPELLPGLLGVLKAGGAYVPVDPGYPAARIQMLLEDSRARAVLVGGGVEAGTVATTAPVHEISGLYRGSDAPLAPLATSEDVAYVIYTSGSTGRPKGVMVEHHSVVNRLTWMQRRYPIGPGDTLLQKTPISFDVSVWELFWWACEGARVALLPPGGEKDPREIVRAIRDHGVTAVHFVPSMLGPFLDLLEDAPRPHEQTPSLRHVFCSGEALPAERVNQFNRVFAAAAERAPLLVNLYGPTEAAVDVTYHDCPPAAQGPVTRVPIGRPVENTTIYVLGEHGGPQPVGVPGELCIGGVQVARGYLDRPELTAERFVKDPFNPGGRLYRTGDLARLLADGTIEYLGRIDGQVKIRGNRVELGEVHNALVSLDGVDDAVVVDHRPEGRGPVLVGYYTAGAEIDPAELRARLGESLPEYMVPSHFVRIDRIPLTPNGKADRRALPAPTTAASDTRGGAPRTATEAALADIWARVIGVERVGVHDDYFALGGDSIMMLRVRALAEKQGIHFTLTDLVRNPTVAALAGLASAVDHRDARPGGDGELEPFALVSRVDRARLEGAEDAYPLTRLQLGLLFHSREQQDSAVYKDVFRYSLVLPWDEDAFRAAHGRLVARHPALRSSFSLAGHSEPLQIVHPTVAGGLDVVDLRAEPRERAEARIHGHMQERRLYDYRFDQAPLYHLRVFLLADSVEFVLSFHHALLDGGSVANLVSELLRDYLHDRGGDIAPVPQEEIPSPGLHVAAEREAIAAQESRRYWRDKLAGAVPPLLEGFRPYAPAGGDDGLIVRQVPLPDGLTEAVRGVAREREVPVKSVLFAAHTLLLRVFSGQTDITTGLVTHGRPDVEGAERMCGIFLNSMPVRVTAQAATWFDAVRDVVAQERESHPHRRVPLAVIQEDLGGTALVDTAFNFIHFRQLGEVFQVPGTRSLGFTAWEETNFALLVNAMADPVDGGIQLRMDFSGRQFTQAQSELYADTFVRLLRRIAERPDEPVDFSGLAPATETSEPARQHPDVVTAFEEQVRRVPDAPAVVAEELTWSYAELGRITERIARILLRLGARPGDRIGILMERSPRTVAVLVGAARAGCSVVPLDTSYPLERLRAMVEQGDPVRVVADEAHEHLVEDGAVLLPAESLFDGTLDPAGPGRRQPHLPGIDPGGEAYLLFTSGSTGRPKGVSMPHRALANLVAWQNGIPSGAVGGRTLQYAPLSFDVSFQELYSTLCGGGALVVIDEELRRDMPALLRLVDRAGVERIFLPYVALQRLAEASDTLGIVPSALRAVISSGEQLRVTDEIRRFCSSLDGALLENQYGPTESHVVTAFTMSGDPAGFPALPPIGRPIDGARVLVLDSGMRPVPVGGKGEIYLGGVCLADGYAGRPDLTGERFLDDPARPGERLYRTGDVGMVLPGGEVVCLGRADRQVKVRGYRVEPAEVELAIAEAAAAGLADLSEVAVVARRREGGDTFLAAFLVGDDEHANLDGIRRRLRASLPEYMVPAHYEWLAAMPLTPSGKRDDAELIQRRLTRTGGAERVAPRDARERTLVEMLADLLEVGEVGVHDNLFELGASSITAMRLVVLIEQRFGVALPLSDFIAAPTVAELAQRVEAASGPAGQAAATEFNPLVPIRTDGDRPPMFYVHPMGGNVLCYVPFAKHLPEGQPFYAFQAAGTDAGTEPVSGVEEIAAGYVEAMRRVQPEGPYHIGGWSFGGFVAFEMARQLRAAGQQVGSLILLDTTALNPDRVPWTDDEALIGWFFWELLWLERGGESPEAVLPAELTTLDEKFEFITRLAIDEGVLPQGSTDAIVRRLFHLYRTNWRAAFDYRPDLVDQDMVLIHAKEPLPDVLMSMHSAIGSMHADPANGWRDYTSGRLRVVDVEGDHLTIMEEPYVSDVVGAVLDASGLRTKGDEEN